MSYTAGNMADPAGNNVASFTVTSTDAVAAVVTSATATTTTSIVVDWSENLGAGVVAGDFAVSGNTVSSVATSTNRATLTLGTAIATNATPSVTYTQGTLADIPGNLAADSGSVLSVDGIGPSLLSVTWDDADDDGNLDGGDGLVFVFDEPMDETTVTSTGTGLDADLVPSAGSYGADPTLSWSTDSTTLTVTVTGTPTVVSGATVDPDPSVTDVVGNADSTTAPGPAIVQATLSLVADNTTVVQGDTVLVSVNLTSVDDFDAAAYTVSYGTTTILTYVSSSPGTINGTAVPISAENSATAGTLIITQNIAGTAGATGSGSLATLMFTFTGNSGQSQAITFAAGSVPLSDTSALSISVNQVTTSVGATLVPGDANGDSTLNALDIVRAELIVAGLVTGVTTTNSPGADACLPDRHRWW